MLECGLLDTDANGYKLPVAGSLVDVDAGAAKLRTGVALIASTAMKPGRSWPRIS